MRVCLFWHIGYGYNIKLSDKINNLKGKYNVGDAIPYMFGMFS